MADFCSAAAYRSKACWLRGGLLQRNKHYAHEWLAGHFSLCYYELYCSRNGGYNSRRRTMRVEINDDLDLEKIAESGQCFRWKRLSGGSWLIPAFGKYVIVRQLSDAVPSGPVAGTTKPGPVKGRHENAKAGDSAAGTDAPAILDLSCTPEEYETYWKNYFDLETSYKEIRAAIDPADTFLTATAGVRKGIRILRQEAFETLISFLISQRKSIPAISTAIERLCRVYGRPIGEEEGETIYSFPTPESLSAMKCEKYGYGNAVGTCPEREAGFSSCGLGYRLPYIKKAADFFAANGNALTEFSSLSDEDLKEALLSFYGVGIKVASCTMLFGFHRLDAFPVDVWMQRALHDHYPDGFDFDRYRPYNGVMQQYIFTSYRLPVK